MKIKLFVLLLACIVMQANLLSQTFSPGYLDGRIMFKLHDNVSLESQDFIRKLPFKSEPELVADVNDYPQVKSVLNKYSFTKLERPSYYTKIPALMRIFRVYFSDFSEIDKIIKDLEKLDIVEYAEKEPIYQISLVPNDALYGQSSNKWYLTQVNAELAWNITLGSNNIKLAVVDNAVFCGHSDLTAFAQRDVADGDNDATPPSVYTSDFTWSHGTHASGLATADVNNGIGMASLGGNVELIGVKCTPNTGNSASIYYSYDGIQWACQNGANVVSMSFGGGGYSTSTQTLINNYPTVVFVAAAGNDGSTAIQYPGGYNNVICVGSVDATDLRSSFSNYNGGTQWVDIAAPGGYSNGGLLNTVYSTAGNSYSKMAGTSMACPLAAGLCGMMLSLNPSLSPADILSCITGTGVNINQNIGPRINAYGALQCVQSTMNGDPMANFIASNPNITVGNSVTFTDLSNNGGNPITSWQWTFSGGTPASYTGQTPPAITYSAIGSYNVTLVVTNVQNSDTETKTGYINVTVQPYGGWIEQASGFTAVSRGINWISIVDQNVVWGTAYDGSGGGANVQQFTKTTNGGTTWTPGTINIGNTALGVSMIHAYSSSVAWLAAYPNAGGQTGGVWKTTDGGSTWTRQSTALYNNAASFTNVVYFWDANNGFCQGDPINGEFECYTTTNGGTTWTVVPAANLPNPLSGEYGYTRQIEVVGDNVWFTTNKGRIYKSTNRGLNFVVYQSPITDFGGTTYGNISFKDANTGLLVDNAGSVWRSTDGSATWNTVTTTGTVYTSGLCFVEGTNIVFSTGSGSSYSEDGGTNWNPIDAQQHTAVEFISPSIGWSGWFNESSTSRGMWKWQNLSTLVVDFSAMPTNVCAGTTVAFTDLTTGGTPTSWSWSFSGGTPSSSSAQNPTITYNTPGTYNVTLIADDGNGPVTYTINNYISVTTVPAQPSTVTGTTSPCVGQIIDYSVTPVVGVTYIWQLPSGWSGTSTSNSISATVGSQSGTITVTPSNSCGNGTARTLSVTPLSEPTASFTYVDNLGTVTFTNTSSPNGTSFQWYFGDGGSSTQENPVYTYSATGNYNVTFITTNSCNSDSSTQVVNITIIGISELSGDLLVVYPNPASDVIYIEHAFDELNYEIFNLTGELVEQGLISGKNSSIGVDRLPKGMYFMNLVADRQIYKFKIAVK